MNDRRFPKPGGSEFIEVRRARMYDNLTPTNNAMGQIADWNNTDYAPDDDEEKIAIYDAEGRCCALKGEYIWIRWMLDSERWEVLGEYGLTRIGKLAGTLTQGGSQSVDIWTLSALVDPNQSVTGYDWLMKSGAPDVANGTKVIIQYMPYLQKWIITEAGCT